MPLQFLGDEGRGGGRQAQLVQEPATNADEVVGLGGIFLLCSGGCSAGAPVGAGDDPAAPSLGAVGFYGKLEKFHCDH